MRRYILDFLPLPPSNNKSPSNSDPLTTVPCRIVPNIEGGGLWAHGLRQPGQPARPTVHRPTEVKGRGGPNPVLFCLLLVCENHKGKTQMVPRLERDIHDLRNCRVEKAEASSFHLDVTVVPRIRRHFPCLAHLESQVCLDGGGRRKCEIVVLTTFIELTIRRVAMHRLPASRRWPAGRGPKATPKCHLPPSLLAVCYLQRLVCCPFWRSESLCMSYASAGF